MKKRVRECGFFRYARFPSGGAIRRSRFLAVGGDVDRLDLAQMGDAVPLRPGGEPGRGPGVGVAGVWVPDMGGEELDDAPAASRPGPIRSAGVGVEV